MPAGEIRTSHTVPRTRDRARHPACAYRVGRGEALGFGDLPTKEGEGRKGYRSVRVRRSRTPQPSNLVESEHAMSIRSNRQTPGTETVTIKCDKCETTTRVIGVSPTDHRTARAIAARSSWSIWSRRNPVPIRDLCPAHGRR